MNARKIIIPLSLFVLLASAAQAQKGLTKATIEYNVGLPVGSFKTGLSKTSLRGFQASVLYGLNDKLSVGLGTGYQDFYQKDNRRLYKLSDGSDLSAVRSQSIQVLPVLATAKYNFTPGAAVQPYAALGVGANLLTYADLYGEFGEQQSKVGFAARPEAGVYVPFKKDGQSGFTLGASYNVLSFDKMGFSNLNNIGLYAGVSIPLRK